MLVAHKAGIDGEVAELAEPVRAPGVQIQFGKRAGDHTADAVTQMQRSISAGELHLMSIEIERAILKLDEDTYGICDGCGSEIAPGATGGPALGDALCQLQGFRNNGCTSDINPAGRSLAPRGGCRSRRG